MTIIRSPPHVNVLIHLSDCARLTQMISRMAQFSNFACIIDFDRTIPSLERYGMLNALESVAGNSIPLALASSPLSGGLGQNEMQNTGIID